MLDYLFTLFPNHSQVLEDASSEVGAAGVERDDALETVTSTQVVSVSRGKRKRNASEPAFQSFVESSASMAVSAVKLTRCAEMVSLSATLKNLRECEAASALITAVDKQHEDALSPGAMTREMSTGGEKSWLTRLFTPQGPERPEGRGDAVDGQGGTGGVPGRVTMRAREATPVGDEEGGVESFDSGLRERVLCAPLRRRTA